MKVGIDNSVKIRHLKPGDTIEGKLLYPVFLDSRELFPQGSRALLTVGSLGRRRRVPNDHWPWVIKAFTPRHENFPLFKSARIVLPNEREVPLDVSLVSIAPEVQVRPNTRRAQSVETATLLGRTSVENNPSEAAVSSKPLDEISGADLVLPAGTRTHVILLSPVSASHSHLGDTIEARVIEPIRIDNRLVLPQGSMLEGRISKVVPPRWLSRSGTLLLEFTNLSLLARANAPVETSITEATLAERSHTSLDTEGDLRGAHPGKAWMLINLGVTAGIAKEADDTFQLIAEAIVATATDASTAGTARIIGACASGLFMITRHGRDVVLPKFTEMGIMFDKPLSLHAAQ